MTPHQRPVGTRTKIATRSAPASSRRPVPIVALDFPRADLALAMVDRLGNACTFYKVGGELFTAAGPQVVQILRALGKDVFLDLKLHDIPNTVRGAARSAASIGAKLVSVHATGGREMIEAAVEGAGPKCGEKLKLLVPGIRPAGSRADDQKRAVTAAEAARAGANYIVLGRMITEAKDPASELRSVMQTL